MCFNDIEIAERRLEMTPHSHWVTMGFHSNSSAPVEQYLYLEEAIQHLVSNYCRASSHVNAKCIENRKRFSVSYPKTVTASRHTVSKDGEQVPPDPEGVPGILT